MSHESGRISGDDESASAELTVPDFVKEERLRTAYDGVEHVDEFHLFVEADGKLKVVSSGMAVPFSPTIDAIYAVFMDGIEYQYYSVELGRLLAPSGDKTGKSTSTVHKLRQRGSSEWKEPWSVKAIFEEYPEGWLTPTKLTFAGLAKPVSLRKVIDTGIEGGPAILKDLI